MRNLKKILAMVLALVMSLSLMAAAGATDFKDDGDISDTYRQAIEVLSGLKVFNGDQNGNFNPEQSITRAEVAAIIYRITTGDVTGDGKDSYSVYSNQFTDVKDTDWFAGYVSYCHNAGYVKGHADHTFGPNDPVTGYQALAMILRAVGYDKNNEFVGDNWQINTASRATTEGVLDNVKGEPLGSEAARKLVAEILFRSILLQNVQWNIVKQDYDKLDTRVCDVLGLKEVTGVVLANADADLTAEDRISVKGTQTLILAKDVKGNRPNDIVEAGKTIVLDIASDLEAIGEMRLAYVQKDKTTYKPVVNTLYEVGSVVTDNEYKTTSVATLAGTMGIDAAEEEYIDYDRAKTENYKAEIRIRYFMDVVEEAAAEAKVTENSRVDTRYYWHDAVQVVADDATTPNVNESNEAQYPGVPVGHWVYDRVIKIDEAITKVDINNMKTIFNIADKYNNNADELVRVASGEVYVGTASVDDKSDTMKWKDFLDTYIDTTEVNTIGTVEKGNYLKVIDIDDDGDVDYALKREYYLDRVASIYNGKIYYENDQKTGVGTGRTSDGEFSISEPVVYAEGVEPEVGDVILRHFIDGVWYGEIVEPLTITVKTVDWKNSKIIDTDANEYTASGIALDADMDYDLMVMDEQVQYNLYRDKGGYVRAYELAQGSQYALLTEMYPTGRNNGAFVTNDNWITELMRIDDKYPAEYSLLNSYTNGIMNPFIDNERNKTPFNVSNTGVSNIVTTFYKDYLQEAIGHLGLTAQTDADRRTGIVDGDEFAWNNTDTNKESWTNVGKYIMGENGVSLYTASEFATKNGQQLYYAWVDLNEDGYVDADEKFDVLGEKNTNSLRKGQKVTLDKWKDYVNGLKESDNDLWKLLYDETAKKYAPLYPVYAVDYIKLAQDDIASAAKHYDIADANDETFGNGDRTDGHTVSGYGYLNNDYVDSVDDTEYYLVSGNSIRTFTGYKNVPAIGKEFIRAIYAVAENTTYDLIRNDYWVARVIVIELEGAYSFDSISLAYYNPYQTTSQVHGLDTLNNEAEGVNLRIHPQNMAWGNQWGQTPDEIGFYGLVGQDMKDDLATASSLERIGIYGRNEKDDGTGDYVFKYNANHIFAGQIARDKTITGKGQYFDVYTDRNFGAADRARTTLPVNVPIYVLTASSSNGRTVVNASGPHNIVEDVIQASDKIVWVTDGRGDVAFVLDLDYADARGNTYGWSNLGNEWNAIIDEQNKTQTPGAVYDYDVTITATGSTLKDGIKTVYGVNHGNSVLIPQADLDKAGFTCTVEVNGESLTTTTIDGVVYYVIPNVTADTEVVVTYLAGTADLKINVGTTGASIGTVTADGTTVTGGGNWASTGETLTAGQVYVISLGGLNTREYTYDLDTASKNAGAVLKIEDMDSLSTTATVTGTFGTALTVTLTREKKAVTPITYTPDVNVDVQIKTLKSDGTSFNKNATNGDVKTGQDIVFTVEAKSNFAIKEVVITQTSKAVPFTEKDGTYTIDKAYNNGKAIAISVVLVSTTDITVTIDKDATNGVYVDDVAKADNDTIKLPYTGGTLTITSDDPVDVTVGDPTKAVVTRESYNEYTVKVTGNVTITIADRPAVEDEVKPDLKPTGETAVDDRTGLSYSSAYEAAGITFQADDDGNVTIIVSRSQYAEFLRKTKAGEISDGYIKVLRPAENGSYTQVFLAAGVVFTAPDDAKSVDVYEWFEGEGSKPGSPDTYNKISDGARHPFDDSGVHTYVKFTGDGTWNATSEDFEGGAIALAAGRHKIIEMQFKDTNGDPIGTPVTRNVYLTFAD